MSLSPLATRFLIELGAAHRLVGADAESAARPELAGVPVVDLAAARVLVPDLVLIADLARVDARMLFELESDGVRVVEFAPHDLEDVGRLSRSLGAELVGVAAAASFERRFSRPLALVSGISSPLGRLRVVAVVDLDPLTVAGGHSFETDLIEIGGGTSVTHGREDSQIVVTPADWEAWAADLVVVVTRSAPSADVRRAARAQMPEGLDVEFFDFDREGFWLDAPEEDAERMRRLIERAASRRSWSDSGPGSGLGGAGIPAGA